MKQQILSLIFTLIIAFNAFAVENDFFSVSADATVKVAPNRVVMQIGAETRGENLAAVKQSNFNTIKKTLAVLKKNGIEEKYIGTDNVNIDIRYKDNWNYSDSILGFIVMQNLAVTITDVSKYEKIMTEIIDAGINRIYNIEFQTDELKKHRFEARSLAIAAAKEKAEFLSGEAGFQLGKIINLRESTNDFYFRPRSNDRHGMSQNIVQEYNGGNIESDVIAPGMISIKSSITLFYSIK